MLASNKPLMGCGPLTDWLKKKRCTYSIDNFDDNLCGWRYLTIQKRHVRGEKNHMYKRNREAV